jgi:N-acetylmuramoyl-L-alanine amidase
MRRGLVALLLVLFGACASGQGGGARPLSAGRVPATTTTTPPAAPATTPSTTAAPRPATTAPPPTPPATAAAPVTDVRALVTATGVVVPVEAAAAGGGWLVRTPCGATAVVTRGTPVGPTTVVLDPGHGGGETGAVGPNGLTEATVNLAVARQARAALQRAGIGVVLTRDAEYRLSLATRGELATRIHPRAFVSIHHNAEPDGPRAGPGTETYYQIGSADSKRLAGLIYEEVVRALSAYPVAWMADRDAGAKYRPGSGGHDYYAMLRLPAAGGVTGALAELAYISDAPEAALLARPDVQAVEGQAVARGIIRYLTTSDPGSGFVTPYPRTEPAGGGGGSEGCVDPAL